MVGARGLGSPAQPTAEDLQRDPLRHSDVVAFGFANPDRYSKCGVTVIDWGEPPPVARPAGEAYRALLTRTRELGIRFNISVGFVTSIRRMMERCPAYAQAVCRDIDGNPLTVPWMWDAFANDGSGRRPYWFCTNSPLYRDFLRECICDALATKPDGLHFDDFAGTAGTLQFNGCFCDSCLRLFRDYLQLNFSGESLAKLGVTHPDTFNYAQFLKEHGVRGVADYSRRRETLPLYPEFKRFQMLAMVKTIRMMEAYAWKRSGRRLAFSVNGDPSSDRAIAVRELVGYYSCEVGMEPSEKGWEHLRDEALSVSAAYAYKSGDMVHRRVAATADGRSWAYIKDHGAINLCRYWIAEAFAFGQCFLVPSENQWCYSDRAGTQSLHNKIEDYADLYLFVRQNEQLFDGYETFAKVGVLWNGNALRGEHNPAQAIAALVNANIPCSIVEMGDDASESGKDEDLLTRDDVIVVPKTVELGVNQKAMLQRFPKDRVVMWDGATRLSAEIRSPLCCKGASRVWLLARTKNESGAVLLHVLNRNYDHHDDHILPQRDLVIKVARSLFGGSLPKRCYAYAPGKAVLPLVTERTDDAVEIRLPLLELWNILRFE